MRPCVSRAAAASRPPRARSARARASTRSQHATGATAPPKVQIASLCPPPAPLAPLQRPRRRERRAPPQRFGTRCPTPRKSCRWQVQRRELQTRGPSQLPSRSTSIYVRLHKRAGSSMRKAPACRTRPDEPTAISSDTLGRRRPSRPGAQLRSCLAPSSGLRPPEPPSGAPTLVPRAEPAAPGAPMAHSRSCRALSRGLWPPMAHSFARDSR